MQGRDTHAVDAGRQCLTAENMIYGLVRDVARAKKRVCCER